MHRSYFDITSRIAEPPLWWQEGGIPRYDKFDPQKSTGIYSSEVALAEIACSNSGIRFIVTLEGFDNRAIARSIRDFSLSYGDPPNVDGVTPFHGAETVKVLQYWYRNHPEYLDGNRIIDKRYSEWRRDKSLEVQFPEHHQIPGDPVYWTPANNSSDLPSRSVQVPSPPATQWWKRLFKV